MHAYRKFVQMEMDKRGWTAADLQRSSGLTKQNLSRLLNDERVQMQQRPDGTTVTALARAFGVDEIVVLSYVAEAMGLPTARVEVAAAADLSNDELLRVLAERLSRGGTDERERADHEAPADRDAVEDPAVSDGATTEPEDTAHRPLPEDIYGLAASRGPRGRDRIDRLAAQAGEESQDPGSDDPA